MFTLLRILVLVVFAWTVDAQKNFGSNCRNVHCGSSQQCLGLYEPCKAGLVDGSSCGFYATCVDLDGEVKHSDPKPVQRESTSSVASSDKGDSGSLYPSLPNQASAPQGGYYPPPNQQGGYYPPPNQQGGYYPPPNQQGGYYPPPNQQGGYYPPPNQQGGYYPQGYPNYPPPSNPPGNKQDSDSDSGFGSFLSAIGKGIAGSQSTSSGSGSGGIDFSGLLSTFTGGNDNRNQQPRPNPSYSGNNAPNPNQPQDNGPSFLQTLGNFATSPLGQQLIVSALQNKGNSNNNNPGTRNY